MIIDTKLNLNLRALLTEAKMGKKGIDTGIAHTSINKTVVTSTENKNVDMNLSEEEKKELERKKKKKAEMEAKEAEEKAKNHVDTIVRDPMILLRLI
jgi:hypothetical protein